MTARSVVLAYHAVGATPQGPLRNTFVPVDVFERQMDFLAPRRRAGGSRRPARIGESPADCARPGAALSVLALRAKQRGGAERGARGRLCRGICAGVGGGPLRPLAHADLSARQRVAIRVQGLGALRAPAACPCRGGRLRAPDQAPARACLTRALSRGRAAGWLRAGRAGPARIAAPERAPRGATATAAQAATP